VNKAIETLMHEHRVIEQVLGSLATLTARLEAGEQVDRARLSDFAAFFRNFADRCHHGKEEDLLFEAMTRYGFSREVGPLAVMLAEHVEGRRCVGELARVGEGEGELTPAERARVVEAAHTYVPLLRAHIQKEDQILYPMATQHLPATVMEGLAKQFDVFEANVMGAGEHERFHTLADHLVAAFPPTLPAASTPFPPCHHHHG